MLFNLNKEQELYLWNEITKELLKITSLLLVFKITARIKATHTHTNTHTQTQKRV